ncbi:hypothetical protein JCM19241_286 [Vibrio ishigakensis]|uniref:DUF4442 domain-containing protein n=1 Tax=Vibrio ishigakensis TaxID=1481914 RepID=A0A0B8QLP3_9VIBR|nr:hypothetical protein JCM19241_286 [Vibrio ishigakensis]
MHIDEARVEVKIPLRRRTKNHLNSMYMGALVVGADVAGGFLAAMKAQNQGQLYHSPLRELRLTF